MAISTTQQHTLSLRISGELRERLENFADGLREKNQHNHSTSEISRFLMELGLFDQGVLTERPVLDIPPNRTPREKALEMELFQLRRKLRLLRKDQRAANR